MCDVYPTLLTFMTFYLFGLPYVIVLFWYNTARCLA